MNSVKEKIKENFNIPNILSIIRIIIIAPFVYYFLIDNYFMATVMIIISGLSDMFDGLIARKFNQITRLGAMLDPIADKLTLTAVVFCIGLKFKIMIPLVIILVLKEFLMLIAGLVLLKKGKTPPAAKWYGKLATVVFYFSAALIVALKAIWNIENMVITVCVMLITMSFMIYAFVRYFMLFIEMLNHENKKSVILKNKNGIKL